MKTVEEFIVAVGREPCLDDMDRVNCDLAGQLGHEQCGWCYICDKPRFMCSHLIAHKKEDTPLARTYDDINEGIKSLEHVQKRLREMCHLPDCLHFVECPENHRYCKAVLSTATAIIWVLADKIEVFCREDLSYHLPNSTSCNGCAFEPEIIMSEIEVLERIYLVVTSALRFHDHSMYRNVHEMFGMFRSGLKKIELAVGGMKRKIKEMKEDEGKS